MKKLILISLLTLTFSCLSFAGGDYRDQVLPLNSLNILTEVEPSVSLGSTSKPEQEEKTSEASMVSLEQLLKEIENDIDEALDLSNEASINNFIKNFKENFIDSYSGRFILLGIFVLFLFLILIFNMFFSRK